ncbi:acyl-CoA synthetase (AMP-forming)/AMP-acid ligase II [Geomicrobium halophilum]|uniref:Acyl-CoA synthetase (AMP-forming)/AMP-acid ligase II n=1 Tax=Geomicrobium halophilum TaxID=549000 RepID=A0A841PWM8_9BACL|nr:class I adenylate-forming enzyme family protein [Geomicrobium halophilum]MBB6448743.1 acyl-CoA synthetase (AMP-forming)/AMP-acid ligase II [Geomicrobium halophilum]
MQKGKMFGRDVFLFDSRPETVTSMFKQTVSRYPEREAIVFDDLRWTYQQLHDNVNVIVSYFHHQCNLQKGDRIALLVGNHPAFIQVFLACAKLGIIAIPLNVKSSKEELLFMVQQADAQLVCAESGFEELLRLWKGEKRQLLTVENSNEFNNLQNVLQSPSRNSHLITPELKEEDPLYIMYTSGTTGQPKGAIGSHGNVIHSAMSYKNVLQVSDPARTLLAVPMYHVTGLIGQFIYMLLIGGTTVLMKRYQTLPFLKLIENEKINFLFNVPTIYIMMMNHPEFRNLSMDSLEVAAYGGAPMAEETIEKLMKELPSINLHNAYGATETSSPATIMPKNSELSKMASVGKAVPVGELKIVGEQGGELEPGEVGELYVKGPMVVKGYWKNEEGNHSSFEDGYWKSGDMAMKDDDGYIYIMDRKKDMINRGGEKIFSAEVENELYSHPEVLEVAIVAVPDEVFGEQVKAFIVPQDATQPKAEDIQSFLKERIADYKIPKYVELIEELPRNPGGKILKRQLTK